MRINVHNNYATPSLPAYIRWDDDYYMLVNTGKGLTYINFHNGNRLYEIATEEQLIDYIKSNEHIETVSVSAIILEPSVASSLEQSDDTEPAQITNDIQEYVEDLHRRLSALKYTKPDAVPSISILTTLVNIAFFKYFNFPISGADLDEVSAYFPDTPTIPLNADYTAKIHNEYIEVGCQKIDFNKIDLLYAIIEKVRNNESRS
jgi:hypothetical protein